MLCDSLSPREREGVRGKGRTKLPGSTDFCNRLWSQFLLAIHSDAMYCGAMLAKELVAASTEPLILTLLSAGESYGYALMQEVKRLSGEKIEWTDGMLYPVLHRMEREGWITSRWGQSETGRKRRYYSIKQDGRKALKDQREQWVAVSGVFRQLWKQQYV
jgi:PadR family transcriptional regulator, regulatory protein PadR